MAGRPTTLDEAKCAKVCELVAQGNTRRCAAACVGVSYSTLKSWMQKGKAGRAPYASFLAQLKRADAQAEANMCQVIVEKAQDGTWQAAAWWLERRLHARWGSKDKSKWTDVSPEAAPEATREELDAEIASYQAGKKTA